MAAAAAADCTAKLRAKEAQFKQELAVVKATAETYKRKASELETIRAGGGPAALEALEATAHATWQIAIKEAQLIEARCALSTRPAPRRAPSCTQPPTRMHPRRASCVVFLALVSARTRPLFLSVLNLSPPFPAGGARGQGAQRRRCPGVGTPHCAGGCLPRGDRRRQSGSGVVQGSCCEGLCGAGSEGGCIQKGEPGARPLTFRCARNRGWRSTCRPTLSAFNLRITSESAAALPRRSVVRRCIK